MENNFSNATMRSFGESFNVVANPEIASLETGNKKATRKRTRNLFSEAKIKTIALYDKVKWLEYGDSPVADLFKKCLQQTLKEMTGYNEAAFKKDLATHMAFLLNDRRFDQTCKTARWSLFKTSQLLAWTSASDFKKIRDYGIANVTGFNTPAQSVYESQDLGDELAALGFSKEFFKDDPYYNWPDEKIAAHDRTFNKGKRK